MNGIEWIVEAHGCASAALTDLRALQSLFERIIRDLNLRPIGETHWHRFPQTGGITGLCLLAESHLAVHTFPEFGSLCLNLFCCVPRAEWDFSGMLQEMMTTTSFLFARPYIPAEVPSTEQSPLPSTGFPNGSLLA